MSSKRRGLPLLSLYIYIYRIFLHIHMETTILKSFQNFYTSILAIRFLNSYFNNFTCWLLHFWPKTKITPPSRNPPRCLSSPALPDGDSKCLQIPHYHWGNSLGKKWNLMAWCSWGSCYSTRWAPENQFFFVFFSELGANLVGLYVSLVGCNWKVCLNDGEHQLYTLIFCL